MTLNELKRHLPHASPDFLSLNADHPPPYPLPEQTLCHDPVATASGEKTNPIRIIVRIKSLRRKLLDPDNLFGGSKYFTDGLRYAGLIPSDTDAAIALEVRQQKVKSKAQEWTVIEIIPPQEQKRVYPKTRAGLVELLWERCGHNWNRQAFDVMVESLSDVDLALYITKQES